jgi:hypothetical protein
VSGWSADDLRRIAATDDLHISPFREDGATYGTPMWIWSVVVDGELYARAYNGQATRLIPGRAAAAGRPHLPGREFEVASTSASAAYRAPASKRGACARASQVVVVSIAPARKPLPSG